MEDRKACTLGRSSISLCSLLKLWSGIWLTYLSITDIEIYTILDGISMKIYISLNMTFVGKWNVEKDLPLRSLLTNE
jgi:hypothetical protein